MKIKIQIVIEPDPDPTVGTTLPSPTPVVELEIERPVGELTPQTLGLTLADAKTILATLQQSLVTQQLEEWLSQKQCCSGCGATFATKGQHHVVYRSLFGRLKLVSPRFYQCQCQSEPPTSSAIDTLPKHRTRPSFSPVAGLLKERTAPELVYLETKWASQISYNLTGQLLADFLPLARPVSKAVLTQKVQKVAKRLEAELSEEPLGNITDWSLPWDKPVEVAPALVVGIDGGYIHTCKSKITSQTQTEAATAVSAGSGEKAEPVAPAKASQETVAGTTKTKSTSKPKAEVGNWFEVIVGKSIASEIGSATNSTKSFGFVNSIDTKARRRVYENLQAQGLEPHQGVIFMSDGGDTVRQVQLYLNPQSESILDWFHVTMRLTVLKQMAKGLPKPAEASQEKTKASKTADEEIKLLDCTQVEDQLERVKWKIWHGQVFAALQGLEDLQLDLEGVDENNKTVRKLHKGVREMHGYLKANQDYLVDYGERYRNGERISTGFVESTVNQLISRRFVKKQQMKWSPDGAHLLLQIRIKVLDGDFAKLFTRWYPGMHLVETEIRQAEKPAA